MTLWSGALSKPCEPETYLHQQSAFGHQTWQDCNLPLAHSYMTLGLRGIGNKTHLDVLLPINLYDPLITWSWKITWQAKTIISPLPHQKLMLSGSYHIVTWRFIRWSCLDHVKVWKTNISPVIRFTPSKIGRAVATGRSFRTQLPKSSPTLC